MNIQSANNDGLSKLLSPRSIAMVGASPSLDKAPMRVLDNLRSVGYDGAVYPINPKYDEVFDFRCYPSLASLPEVPDVVTLSVAGHRLLGVLEEAAALGVGAAVVYAAAFNEPGVDATKLTAELREFVDRTGMRLLGPSTQGSFKTESKACLSWSAAYSGADLTETGPIGWVSQSGAVGTAAVGLFRGAGIGLSHWISTGNELDLEFSELAMHVLEDPRTTVICGYIEAIRNVEGFRAMADKARQLGKPVILVKGGMSEVGSAAATSHTGALAGSAAVYEAFFRQCGVVLAKSLEELVAIASLAAERPGLGKAGKVAVLSNSGGLGILLADLCDRAGLEVTQLNQRALDTISPLLPDFVVPGNPVDMPVVAMRRPADVAEIISALHEQHSFDAYILALLGVKADAAYDVPAVFEAIKRADEISGGRVIPVLVSGAEGIHEMSRAAGLWSVGDGARVVEAIGSLTVATGSVDRAITDIEADDGIAPALSGRRFSEPEAKALLKSAGMPVPTGMVAADADAAVEAANTVGYPVVLKIASSDILHKTEVGGVRVGLENADEVRQAFEEIIASAAEKMPQAAVDGCLVEAMARPGHEVVIGVQRDESLGLVIMFGLGGINIELFEDVSFRVLPIEREDAIAMIRETRASRLLAGWRGAPPADVDSLVDLLVETSKWIVEQGDKVSEFEMNPVRVHDAGMGVSVLDLLYVER